MDIFYFLLAFSIGWFGGQYYMALQLRKQIAKIAERYGMTLEELVKSFEQVTTIEIKKVPNLVTEYQGNTIYLYNKDTGKFVCQGSSLDELAMLCNDEFQAALVEDKDTNLIFANGKIQNTFNESKNT